MSRVWRTMALWVAILLVGMTLAPAAGAAAPRWEWSSPSPQGQELLAVAFGEGQFVAVGRGGTLLTSADGATWKLRPFWATDTLSGIAFGAGRFVAVGEGGRIVTSADGATWVTQTSPTRRSLNAIAYTGDQFVAAGDGGTILFSVDGTRWEARASGVSYDLNAVAYGGGRYAVAGDMGTVLTSADGAAWTRHPVPTIADLRGAAYGNGRMTVVGEAGTILAAPDGGSFELKGARAEDLYGVAHGSGRFVAMGAQLSVAVMDAPWTVYRTLPLDAQRQMRAVAFGGGQFVGVGARGMIYRSVDGIDWTAAVAGDQPEFRGLAASGSRMVAVGPSGLYASADGMAWTRQHGAAATAVAHGNGFFLAAGATALLSYDGLTWTERGALPFTPDLLLHGNGRFVAIGQAAASSVDGAVWAPATAAPSERLVAGAFGNSRFVAMGESGTVFTSVDGLSWQRGFNPGAPLAGIAFGAGQFLMVSRSGSVFTSVDGTTWAMRPRLGAEVSQVAFAGGQFIASAAKGQVYTSAGGESWTRRLTGAPGAFRSAVQAQGRLVALGAEGSLFRMTGDLTAPCGRRFADVAELYPACEAVEQLAQRSVLSGYPDGTFKPEQAVTRAEFAKLLVLAMGWQPKPGAALPFSDVGGHWAAQQGYLQEAFQMGLINGFPDGTFRPDAPLTRSQAVKMVATAAGLGQQTAAGYADVAPGAWYAGYLGGAQQRSLVGSAAASPLWDGPVFREGELVIRAEAAMLLGNLR